MKVRETMQALIDAKFDHEKLLKVQLTFLDQANAAHKVCHYDLLRTARNRPAFVTAGLGDGCEPAVRCRLEIRSSRRLSIERVIERVMASRRTCQQLSKGDLSFISWSKAGLTLAEAQSRG